jgi:hypothetical protein
MADNVVPDLGALKTYAPVSFRSRTLSFTNGMGANDRAGTLGNWQRSGFAAHDVEREPDRRVVTVVNNRADRLARSEVFANLIVEDIGAHRHVLIGSNVAGLLGFIEQALSRYLERSAPCRDLPAEFEQSRRVVAERIARAFARLKVGATEAHSVAAECRALGFPPLDHELIDRLLRHESIDERHVAGKERVRAALADLCDSERLPFVVDMIARRRAVRALQAFAQARLATDRPAVDAAFQAAYRALFLESLLPLYDPGLSGDAILERVAAAVPPGARASIMGIQNIKGTGLDFVYRWVSIEMVQHIITDLGSTDRDARERAVKQLMIHDDYGMIDASIALAAAEAARASAGDDSAVVFDPLITRLRAIASARVQFVSADRAASATTKLRNSIGETLDFVDAVRRRRMAARIIDQLACGRISHAAAALRMRTIVARSKGAWMQKRA